MNALTYLAIAVGCALFYLLSILTGGDHDLHHGDFGGDHHGTGTQQQGHHDDGTSYKEFLSIRSLLLFGTGFGAAGAISSQLGFGPWLIPIFGVTSGFFFSWVGVKLFRFLRRQEATTSYSLSEIEGTIGQLTVAVPSGGVGQVLVKDVRGEIHFLLAQSEDGLEIPLGYDVEVISATPEKLVVRKIEFLPPVA